MSIKDGTDLSAVKALTFDVFGTVVDWRGSIMREVRELARAKSLRLNAAKFADAWRKGYRPAMDRVASGELPWTKIDDLHRMILDDILAQFKISSLSEEEKANLNRAWHRLKPWPDTVRGLKRLKKRFTIATLSNGNVALLNNMAKNAGLPWGLDSFRRSLSPLQTGSRGLSWSCGYPRTQSRRGHDGCRSQRRLAPRPQKQGLKTALVLASARVRKRPASRLSRRSPRSM
jgi:2-haloalkanoic acid dehalogenase type II